MGSLFQDLIRIALQLNPRIAGTIRTVAIPGLLILFITGARAAEISVEKSGDADAYEQIRFQNITVKNGLSYYRVRVMTQDQYGFMWFGSDYGLERFDGQNISSFKHDPENLNSLPLGTITCLLSHPGSGM